MKKTNYQIVLSKLKERLNYLSGLEKESIEYIIRQLEAQIIEVDDKFRITTTKVIPKENLIQKINKEKNIINGYKKIIMGENAQSEVVMNNMEFSKIKVMLYDKELPYYDDSAPEIISYKKTNGSVLFHLLSYEVDPMKAIHVYIDLKFRFSIDLKRGEEFQAPFESSTEFEMFIIGSNDIVLGVIYLPCEFFIGKDGSILNFDFRNYNYIKVKATFKNKIALLRK